jgi:hypothetical protein
MAKQRRRRKPRPESLRVRQRASEREVILSAPKLVPGIEGRSAWFATRAGAHERALSIERLRSAIAVAENMPDRAAIRDVTFQEAQTLLSGLDKATRDRVLRTPMLAMLQTLLLTRITSRPSRSALGSSRGK